MKALNAGYRGCDGKPERVGVVLVSAQDAEAPGWRNKV